MRSTILSDFCSTVGMFCPVYHFQLYRWNFVFEQLHYCVLFLQLFLCSVSEFLYFCFQLSSLQFLMVKSNCWFLLVVLLFIGFRHYWFCEYFFLPINIKPVTIYQSELEVLIHLEIEICPKIQDENEVLTKTSHYSRTRRSEPSALIFRQMMILKTNYFFKVC